MIVSPPAATAPATAPTMTDRPGLTQTTFRTWAVLDAIYGLLIGALAIWAVPWKWPPANLTLLAYAGAIAAGAPGLWRGARWAWRLASVTCLLGLAAAVLAVSGLVASWAYLRAVYGAFGAGASIASLLIAGMAFQLLGLYPAVRLRALLRREVRASVRAGRSVALVTLALGLVPLAVGGTVHARFALEPLPPLPDPALAGSVALVRARAEGRAPAPAPDLAGLDPGLGPLHVTLWHEGERVARARGTGRDLAEAAEAAGRALQAALQASGRPAQGQIRVDRVVARGPVARGWRTAFSLGLDPGLDGLAAGDRLVFLPDDVLRAAVAGTAAPLAQLDELRAGIDVDWMEARIADAGAQAPLQRLRTESWIEGQGGAGVRRLHRGNPLGGPALSARRAAVWAGDFILQQLESDGRFRYRYQPYQGGGASTGEYSLPRHAGTAYALALLFGYTGEIRFREGAEAALHWLARLVTAHCGPGRACLVEDGRAPVGHAALAAIAMFTYQAQTGDRRYAALAGELVAFLLVMQRPDGELHHVYDVTDARPLDEPPRMFASEQAALALVLAHGALGDGRYLAAAERLLDHLTLRKHDHFLGRFVYGADHWTCLAADAAVPGLAHRRYLDFCRGYAAFMSRLQYPRQPGAPARDFAGHYGFGYLMVPQAPATAGFAEALLATLALANHHRVPAEDLKDQAQAALQALARDQLRPDNSYLTRSPARALGGFRRSLVEPEIRIDFVQHAASALARGPSLGLETLGASP